MIGSKTPSEMRAAIREAFGLSDSELAAWFNRQVSEKGPPTVKNQAAIDALLSLRDALVNEANRPAPKTKARRIRNAVK